MSEENTNPAPPKEEPEMNPSEILNMLNKKLGIHRTLNPPSLAMPHAFWDTQPVPKMQEEVDETQRGPIDPPKTVAEVRKEVYPLPANFEWVSVNLDDDQELTEIYTLLNENYVEDGDAMFRFDYSPEFLRWALTPPGYVADWLLGVRATTGTKRLVGFITAVPASMNVRGDKLKVAEVNFLCVHKKLRAKRLAPVLIKEITRRVNLKDVWQAVYTAGVLLPKPVAKCRYWHRNLNPKKLIEVGFAHLPPRMTLARSAKLYKLPDQVSTEGLRPMKSKDAHKVSTLLNSYLDKFPYHPTFTAEEVKHWLLPREKVVHAFVREDPETKQITDLLSFYALPSSILNHPVHSRLEAAYSFWNVATSIPLKQLISDAMILARDRSYDVFNALDLMDNNEELFKELKFGIGDGFLHYYLYNWKCPVMAPTDIGLVLL